MHHKRKSECVSDTCKLIMDGIGPVSVQMEYCAARKD